MNTLNQTLLVCVAFGAGALCGIQIAKIKLRSIMKQSARKIARETLDQMRKERLDGNKRKR
jgi:hypothetical protein